MDVDRALVAVPVSAPHAIEELLARQDESDVAREISQQIELACGQGCHLTESSRLAPPDVNLEVPHTHHFLRRRAFPRSTQDGVHPGDQLSGREGLDQVIVRSELETEDTVHLVIAGSQEENGDVALRPDPAAYIETVELTGKSDIENDDPRILLVHEHQALFSVPGEEHPKAIAAQIQVHEVSNMWIVFDDDHSSGLRIHGP
jgi:hypothetical protein